MPVIGGLRFFKIEKYGFPESCLFSKARPEAGPPRGYHSAISFGNFLGLLQSKARLKLKSAA
jgi:hypothetical protein